MNGLLMKNQTHYFIFAENDPQGQALCYHQCVDDDASHQDMLRFEQKSKNMFNINICIQVIHTDNKDLSNVLEKHPNLQRFEFIESRIPFQTYLYICERKEVQHAQAQSSY